MQVIANLTILISLVFLGSKAFYKYLPHDLELNEKRSLLRLLIFGIAFKLIIISVWYMISGPYYLTAHATGDSGGYYNAGVILSEYFRNFTFYSEDFYDFVAGKRLSYSYVLGILFAFCGPSYLAGSIFNGLASIFIAVGIYFTAYNILGRKIARTAFILNLFYPHYISMSYVLLKDIFLISFVVFYLLLIRNISERSDVPVRLLGMSFFFLVVIFDFRTPVAVILTAISMLYLIIFHSPRFSLRGRLIWIVALGIFLVVFTQLKHPAEDKPSFTAYTDKFRGVSSYSPYFEKEIDLSGIYVGTDASTIMDNIASITIAAIKNTIYAFWGPPYFYMRGDPGPRLIWIEEEGKFVLWENLSVLLRFFLMPMVILGLWTCMTRFPRKTFLIYGYFFTWLAVIILTNADSRWALMIMPYLLVFGATGIYRFNSIKSFYILYILFLNISVAVNITWYDSLIVAKPLFWITSIGIILIIFKTRKKDAFLFGNKN